MAMPNLLSSLSFSVAYGDYLAVQRGALLLALDVSILATLIGSQLSGRETMTTPTRRSWVLLLPVMTACCFVATAAGSSAVLALQSQAGEAVPLYLFVHVATALSLLAASTSVTRGTTSSRLFAQLRWRLPLAFVSLLLLHSSITRLSTTCAVDSVAALDIAAVCCLGAFSMGLPPPHEDAPPSQPPTSQALAVTPYHHHAAQPLASTALFDAAPWWSRLLFAHLTPFFSQRMAAAGAATQLQLPQIDPMPRGLATRDAVTQLRGILAARATATTTAPKPSLLRILLRQHGLRWAYMGLLQAGSVALSFAGPAVLNRLLAYLQAPDGAVGGWDGLLWATLMALQALFSSVLSSQYNLQAQRIQAMLRAGLFGAVFSGALAPPGQAGAAPLSTGQLTNHVSVDIQQISDAVASVHQFWALPLQVAITLFLLYTQVSWAFTAGCAVLLLFTPLNMWISKRIGALTRDMMVHRDERVRVTGEVLRAIRVVKMQGWEALMSDRIAAARVLEVRALAGRKYLDAVCVYLWASTPVLVSISTFATVVLLAPDDGSSTTQLSASVVFTTLSLLNMLIFPMNALPWVISGTLQAFVSLRRIDDFLAAPLGPCSVGPPPRDSSALLQVRGEFTFPLPRPSASAAAADDGGTGASTPAKSAPIAADGDGDDDPRFRLRLPALGLTVHAGELVVVCGVVGAGKTALLGSMIGDLCPGAAGGPPPVSLAPDCSLSYAPQTPWIRGISLRDNVCAGEPWDAGRYSAVLEACALQHDVASMTARDATLVSATTLSGGQQQRVGLARALYARSSLVLLDDCVSALDASVGAQVWRCALGGRDSLLAREGRARVVVTHDHRFFADADTLVVIEAGAVIFCGPPGGAFAASKSGALGEASRRILGAAAAVAAAAATLEGRASLEGHLAASGPTSADSLPTGLDGSEAPAGAKAGGAPAAPTGIEEEPGTGDGAVEERAVGLIRRRVLMVYAAVVGAPWFWTVLLSLSLMQLSRNASDWWLSIWSAAVGGDSTDGDGGNPAGGAGAALVAALAGWTNRDFLLVYGAIAGVNTLATGVRSWSFAAACIAAAVKLHDRMLFSVVHAPMLFHDASPLGRLLNRFSADQFAVDDSLPFQLNILLAQCWGLAGTLLVLAYATYGVFLLAVPLIALANWRLQEMYRHTSREVKRLDSTTRSLLFAHLADALAGASVIRARSLRAHESNAPSPAPALAASALEYEQEVSCALLDDNQRTSFLSGVASQWLSLRLQAIGSGVLALLSFAAIFVRVLTDRQAAAAGDDAGCLPPITAGGVAAGAGPALSPMLEWGMDRATTTAPAGVFTGYLLPLAGVTALGAATLRSYVAAPAVAALLRTSSGGGGGALAGVAGLALAYAIPLVNAIQGLIGAYAETEKEFVAVERVQEYADIPPEEGGSKEVAAAAVADPCGARDDHHPGRLPSAAELLAEPLLSGESRLLQFPASFTRDLESAAPQRARSAPVHPAFASPGAGFSIEFSHLTVRYPGTARPAVDDLSLRISAGERIGIIGRTGSGKSSLIAALWRLVPLEPGGTILVNGLDTSQLPLETLRRCMTIIPQSPVLFSGTVRFNLDPRGKASEAQLLDALAQCGLGRQWHDPPLGSPPQQQQERPLRSFGLDFIIEDGGSNLSLGERCLLCLARAVLSPGGAVCVDEATSSTDYATEELVNRVLMTAFPGRTMLIIAHRQRSLALCDRVIEMKDGEVVGVGAPDVMLRSLR